VAKSPTQAARPTGWSNRVPGEMPGCSRAAKRATGAECRRPGRRDAYRQARNDLRMENAEGERGNRRMNPTRGPEAPTSKSAGGTNRRNESE